MSKHYPLYAIVLLLFTSRALMAAMVAGDKCKKDLGVCLAKDACKSKCSKIHEGGEGICEPKYGGDNNHCWCYYSCEVCEIGLGNLGGCNDTQCNSDCVAKFPGKEATGYCFSIPETPYINCYCRYYC